MKIERVPTPMVDWKKSRKYEVKIFLLQLMSRIKRLDHFTCSHQILHFPKQTKVVMTTHFSHSQPHCCHYISCFDVQMSRYPHWCPDILYDWGWGLFCLLLDLIQSLSPTLSTNIGSNNNFRTANSKYGNSCR